MFYVMTVDVLRDDGLHLIWWFTFNLLMLQEKDETDSGYRSGTIPDDKLPRKPSQATLNREELKKKLEEYNSLVPGAEFILVSSAIGGQIYTSKS